MALVPFPSTPERRPDEDESALAGQPPSVPPAPTPSPDYGQDEEDPEEALDGRMTFLEHLDELRKRLTHSVVALLVGFLASFAFIGRINEVVYQRLVADVPGGKLIFTEPTEAIFLYIKIAAVAGLLLASPYIMWQVWLFIAPGLYSKEKKLAIPFALGSSSLFIAGAAFSHYVLFPAAWRFFSNQAPWYQRVTTFWVVNAKQEETRLRRLAILIADSAAGRRIGLLKPGSAP